MKKLAVILGLLLWCSNAFGAIVLTETTDKIQAVLTGAATTNQMTCVANYRDITTTTFVPGRKVGTTNDTTDADLVEAPSASTQRVVDFISIYNADTYPGTVTVKFDANGTEYTIWKGALAVGERVQYSDKSGWSTYTSSGALKQTEDATNPVAGGWTTVVLSGDVVNNNASANTIADVTGLSFSVTSGKTYQYKFTIPWTSAVNTTGSRWSVNGPTFSFHAYTSYWGLAATTVTLGNYSAYDQPAASSATSPADLVGVTIIEGVITPSANGTLIARFASEVSSSAITAKAGALLEYMEVL